MAFGPPALRRRTRRRRTLVLFLIAGALIAVVALALRYRTDERIARDYLAAAREIADDQVSLAAELEEIMRNVATLERPEILERLDGLSAASADAKQRLAEADLTVSIVEAHGFLTVAVTAWDDALGSLQDAVVEIVDGEDETVGTSLLATAFRSLRVGDRAYFGFLGAVADLPPELVAGGFTTVSYAGGERTSLYDSAVMAERLRRIGRLGGDHDVALTGTVEPVPLVQEGSVPLVPASDEFTVQLVVSNDGNVDDSRILVELMLSSNDASQEPIVRQELVPFLTPGEATTVRFDLADEVRPDSLYELRATVTIEEDGNLDNNVWEMIFIRNAP